MIRKLILSATLLIAGFAVYAQQISIETAHQTAIRFYSERMEASDAGGQQATVASTSVCHAGGLPVYYILSMNPAGFVIVSATPSVIPVLAYSLKGAFDPATMPPQMRAWLKQYEDQIHHLQQNPIPPSKETQRAWAHLLGESDFKRGTTVGNEVTPLILSNWNQNAPYNSACPPDPAGPGGHTYAGCVPTCMGQLMYYYRWPSTGTGSYSYEDPPYGTLSADFGNTTYDWEGMTNQAVVNNPDIAKLLYHLGVSCDLRYGPDGSGMYNHKAAYALRTFFKYSPETEYVYRDSTTLNWDSILVAHLDRKMPMYYAGWSVPNIMGHAFVCDGYQFDSTLMKHYFHFNFGWGGSSNGYFFTNDLFVGGNNFNLAQEVIINAYPDTVNYTYPAYCQGDRRLTLSAGSFTDGSAPMGNYSGDADCSWLIDPQTETDSVTSITLRIEQFSTTPGDLLTVYDGANAQSPVLLQYDGVKPLTNVTSTGNKMFVSFKAAGGPTSTGWHCTYSTTLPVYCTGMTTLTADTAVISNGSAPFNYHNNTNCRWKLFTTDGKPLTIHFRRFETEEGKDILRIYDLGSGDTLATLSGLYQPGSLPDSVTSPSGKMFVSFVSNGSVTGKGWEFYYPISHVGLIEAENHHDLTLYPNPAHRFVTMEFKMVEGSRATYSLTNPAGLELINGKIIATPGLNKVTVPLPQLPSGLYLLRLTADHATSVRKLMVD